MHAETTALRRRHGDAVARFWQSVVDTQVLGRYGVRPNCPAITVSSGSGCPGLSQPNSWATRLTEVSFLRPISRARDVAVGIALPHADKVLAVLKQFEPPVGHRRYRSTERSVPGWESSNRVLLHGAGGAYTPILCWRLCADHQVAPSSIRRSVTTVLRRLVRQNGPRSLEPVLTCLPRFVVDSEYE
jgi:hypothetical protein